MNMLNEIFIATCNCTIEECRLKDELDAALKRYNDLFIPGSSKILKLVRERE
jgi:hypothetical protein